MECYDNNNINEISFKEELEPFKARCVPIIKFSDYINRIKKLTKYENGIFIMALILLEKAILKYPIVQSGFFIHKA